MNYSVAERRASFKAGENRSHDQTFSAAARAAFLVARTLGGIVDAFLQRAGKLPGFVRGDEPACIRAGIHHFGLTLCVRCNNRETTSQVFENFVTGCQIVVGVVRDFKGEANVKI